MTAGAVDQELEFRRCVGAFTTGVTVVTATDGNACAGMTVNSFTSVSLRPLLVSVSLAHETRTLELVRQGQRFAISILNSAQRDVALAFAAPGRPFPEEHTVAEREGYVHVQDALAVLFCRVEQLIECGDHDVAIARVEEFQHVPGEPLVFHRGAFGGLDSELSVIARLGGKQAADGQSRT